MVGFLSLFSGGALTKFAVFGLGIMPYITASIIIQLMQVVIPKFEQWREEGAVGQRKLTQVTRYLTIALAVMQSTGLAYAFHNGGGGLLGGTSLNIDLIPDFTVPRVALVVLTMTTGTVVVMWLARAHHPARHRPGDVGADLHQRRRRRCPPAARPSRRRPAGSSSG